MKVKFCFVIFILIIFSSFASAFLISDQGTNVKESATGNLTASANLGISIYDSSSGGNLIFQQNFTNAIANGSWNVMIDPTLEYGKKYFKDYSINGENLNFDGNDRLEFQSSVGKVNNISFVNFSLIAPCSAGSSIRTIYENGSVECELDDSGSGSADLTNYALKNQSETFTGNITTTQTGFFGWLGSLSSRITKLWIVDINASGNIETSENVSARYFKGDGSLLTNLPAGSGDNSSWNQSLADTLYSGIEWDYNQTTATYNLYNSVWSATFNSTYGALLNQNCPAGQIVNGTLANGTFVCTTVASGSNGNIFNQVLNTTSNVTFGIVNATGEIYIAQIAVKQWLYNQSTPVFSYITANEAAWFSTYNATYASNQANNSWNQSLANTLYAGIQWGYNQSSIYDYNQTGIYGYNQTYSGSTFNATYNNILNQQCPAGKVVNGTLSNGTFVCVTPTLSESDPLFTAENASLWTEAKSKFNSTYASFAYNQTISANSYTDTQISNNNASWISTYNATYASNQANNSWNQSLANTLYAGIQWGYNQTGLFNYNQTYSGSTFNTTYNNILNQQCPAGKVVNGTFVNGTFTCITPPAGTETDPTWAANLTSGISADLNPLTNIIQSFGTASKRWLKGWFQDLDVSKNITVGGNVSAEYYFGNLNRSTFPTSACSGTNKVVQIYPNGTVGCASDQTSGSSTAKSLVAGGTSTSLTVDTFFHPYGYQTGVSTYDEEFGTRIPVTATVHNLTVYMDGAQQSGDICEIEIQTASDCLAASSWSTILTASMVDAVQDANNVSSGSITSGQCMRIFFDEAAGSCVGGAQWSFIMEM